MFRRIAMGAVLALLVLGGAQALAAKGPFETSVGKTVTVKVREFEPGTYSLVLVAKQRPARGASCLRQVGARRKVGEDGAATFRGEVPKRLNCFQGPDNKLGSVKIKPGSYRLVIGSRTGRAAFDGNKSFVRRKVRIVE